jgi:dynein heavy chain
MNLASCVHRIDTGIDSYLKDAEESSEVKDLVAKIYQLIKVNGVEVREFQKPYLNFSSLWTRDIKKSFQEFLHPAKKKAAEDEEAKEDESANQFFGVKLELFEAQISKYDRVHQEIVELPTSAMIGWLRIDAKPMKESIRGICDKWKASFTGYLQDKVESTLKDLFEFMERVNTGLEVDVTDGDLETLKTVMGFIRDCKRRHQATVDMLEPINEVMAMLRRHEAIAPDVLEKLEEQRKSAPEAWNQTYKKSLNKRELLSDRQDAEAAQIKEDTGQFEAKVTQFRDKFQQIPPFSYDMPIDQAYEQLDRWDLNLTNIEEEATGLRNLQELFDLNPSEFKELKDCRSDLKMLKQIWDMTAHVQSQFSDWMKTTFKNVQVDLLLEETKKLQKQLKGFSVRMKSWDAFKGLETEVKNMATSLPLVQDLRSLPCEIDIGDSSSRLPSKLSLLTLRVTRSPCKSS